jgi:3-deoxy-manno-octulosonate cytidylyltransferase (CMP-KDO synthetase)
MKVACIVPARMGSSRYPGKPIAKICGYPMLEHVFRRLKTSRYVTEIVIATCDKEIRQVCEAFGARVIMTKDTHVRGTDRVAEAALHVQADIIINVQGDEPLVDPKTLDEAIDVMLKDPSIPCVNLVSKITDWDIFASRDVVKTVMDRKSRVLYFSRLPVPTQTKEKFKYAYKQIGIYLFKRDFLLQFASWQMTPLEEIESVDMMRILENGFPIQGFLGKDSISVDTPADLAFAEGIISQDPLYKQVFGDVIARSERK